MHARLFVAVAAVVMLLVAALTEGIGQPPGGGKGPPGGGGKGPTDPDKEILSKIKDAYRAPYERPQDLLKELRKYYQNPTESREADIFKEIRWLYLLTAEQEAAILREVRRAAEQPSPEQERRIFREIERGERLPQGAVPPSVQTSQSGKLFAKLDRNGDEKLSPDEMPEHLRGEVRRFDSDRDGLIDANEFWAYYQGRVQWLSEQVSSGKIDLGVKRSAMVIPGDEDPRTVVYRAGKLPKDIPPWFAQLDTDKDGQVSLYEWRRAGKDLKEFAALDPNNDGLATPEEVLRHVIQNGKAAAMTASGDRGPPSGGDKKGKKKK